MKSEFYLTAEITDDDRARVTINGPANKILALLEEEAVQLFEELKNEGCPDTLEIFCLFFKKVTERVFPDDL